jgi:hypothetical protein
VTLGDSCGCGFLVTLGGPPRWLEAAMKVWHMSVIVHGWLRWSCEGSCTFPDHVIELPHLSVGSYGVQHVDEVRATPLNLQTTKCWLTQRGLACRQACEPQEKNHLSLAIGFLPVFILCWLFDWFISSTQRYNHSTTSFMIPQVKPLDATDV